MTFEEARLLLSAEIQEIIRLHRNEDPVEFSLSFSYSSNFPKRAIAEQISCFQKAHHKFPDLLDRELLFHPVAMQQSTGSILAKMKPDIMSMNGKRAIDLTGGLGIDTLFLASHFEEVIYCERDPVLIELARHNFKKLNLKNVIIHHGDSIEHLKNFPDQYFDWIYVDPSRRDENRRYITMEDSSPDVTLTQELFFQKARNTCIKFSPALEISEIEKKLDHINKITVFSVDAECKEIICVQNKNADNIIGHVIQAALIKNGNEAPFILQNDSQKKSRKMVSAVQTYFYEPDPAIIKSRLSDMLTLNSDLSFINSQTDYLTSDTLFPGFPGRIFRTVYAMPFKYRDIATYLTEQNILKANVARRDFPMNPSQIKQKFKLQDGGNHYLFFTKDKNDNKFFIHCVKPGA